MSRSLEKINYEDTEVERGEEAAVFEEYVQSVFAEFGGTLLYTFIACLAVTTENLVAIAFAEGLTIAVLCSAFLRISGGHFNPALTFAVCISGGLNPVLAAIYFIVQLIAAMIGAAFVKAVVLRISYDDIDGGVNKLRGSIPYDPYDLEHELDVTGGTAVVTEILVCIMIFSAYMNANVDHKSKQISGPLAYGFSITAGILSCFFVSGASFNPARSFGAAVCSGYWNEHYIYWAGPFAGAIFSGLFYRLILGDSKRRLVARD
ncbi:aquaporin-8-like [Antedon mediterranea]|uniref:aquaporin-8-like n=1 Tax=Antedon mediterranea TaxID=105859 RepID=UPI003AF76E70